MINESIESKQFEVDIIYTQYAKHAKYLCNEKSAKYNRIVAVGGDGSVNEIAQGLINKNTALAIIPAGSGNGLARHLNIPLQLKRAIKVAFTGMPILIDSIKLNDEYFFCTAGLGFDADVSWEFAKTKKRGFWSYFKIVLKNYLKYTPKTFKVKINNQELEIKNKTIITIANASQYGNNIIIAPKAEINDGFVRLITIDKFPFIHLPAFTYYLLTKKINKFRFYEEYLAKEITIFSNNNQIHIDGEPVETDKNISINVIPQSLKVIV